MKITCIVAGLLLACSAASAQELQVTVNVNAEQLPSPSDREYIADFKQKVEAYMNEYRWTGIDFRGDKIPVSMEIFFLSVTSSKEYTAQVAISSQRRIWENDRPTQRTSILLRVLDRRWSFTYIQGMPFTHDDFTYDPITSFLDFYAYMILAFDFDSYEPMAGTPFYSKALNISQRAQSSAQAREWSGNPNEYSRANLLSECMNATYEPFRKALFLYYYQGLDYLRTEKEVAQEDIARGLKMIAQVLERAPTKSLLITMFFEQKKDEICQVLDGYPKKAEVMKLLASADPARAESYNRCAF